MPSDPSYLKICIAVGHIEQWLENRYPSWIFNADGGLSAIPQYRDETAARSISDARIRQLPESTSGQRLKELRGLQAGMRQAEQTGLSSTDLKILGYAQRQSGGFRADRLACIAHSSLEWSSSS